MFTLKGEMQQIFLLFSLIKLKKMMTCWATANDGGIEMVIKSKNLTTKNWLFC